MALLSARLSTKLRACILLKPSTKSRNYAIQLNTQKPPRENNHQYFRLNLQNVYFYGETDYSEPLNRLICVFQMNRIFYPALPTVNNSGLKLIAGVNIGIFK